MAETMVTVKLPLTIQDLADAGRYAYGEDWRAGVAGWLNVSVDAVTSPRDLEQYREPLVELVTAHNERGQALLKRLRG